MASLQPAARLRRPSAGRRVLVTAAVGLVVGAAITYWQPWQVAVLVGWDGAAIAYLVWVWSAILPLSADDTRRLARLEDDSRAAADIVLLSASVTCLVGVGFDLIKAAGEHGGEKAALVAIGVASVVAAWSAVHTVYVLHYARLYYSEPEGGIDFNEESRPSYVDFAYVAFTIGMTYQVSDTNLEKGPIRRAALRHSLLSYLFGTVIVAMTINVVAGLLK